MTKAQRAAGRLASPVDALALGLHGFGKSQKLTTLFFIFIADLPVCDSGPWTSLVGPPGQAPFLKPQPAGNYTVFFQTLLPDML